VPAHRRFPVRRCISGGSGGRLCDRIC